MITEQQNKRITNFAIRKLHKFIDDEEKIVSSCKFWQIKKKREANDRLKHYREVLESLGDNPDFFTISFRIPDYLLEKMGF